MPEGDGRNDPVGSEPLQPDAWLAVNRKAHPGMTLTQLGNVVSCPCPAGEAQPRSWPHSESTTTVGWPCRRASAASSVSSVVTISKPSWSTARSCCDRPSGLTKAVKEGPAQEYASGE